MTILAATLTRINAAASMTFVQWPCHQANASGACAIRSRSPDRIVIVTRDFDDVYRASTPVSIDMRDRHVLRWREREKSVEIEILVFVSLVRLIAEYGTIWSCPMHIHNNDDSTELHYNVVGQNRLLD